MGRVQVWVRAKFLQKPKLDSDPLRVLKKKTHTRPYNLLGWVKSDPLGSGQVEYLWIGYKLPSLILIASRARKLFFRVSHKRIVYCIKYFIKRNM